MGWAARHNYRMWLALWTVSLWGRLRLAWTVLRSRGLRSWLRAPAWAWLTGRSAQTVEQRRLQAIASAIHSRKQLDALLARVRDPQQRKALRAGLKPYLRV